MGFICRPTRAIGKNDSPTTFFPRQRNNLNFQNANVVAVVSQGRFIPVNQINKAIKDIGSVNGIEENIGTASDAVDATSSISQAVGLYCLAEYVSFDPTSLFKKEIDAEFNTFNQTMVLAKSSLVRFTFCSSATAWIKSVVSSRS